MKTSQELDMTAQEAFDHGSEVAFTALTELDSVCGAGQRKDITVCHMPSGYVGLLTTIMACIRATAPSAEMATEILDMARDWEREAKFPRFDIK